MDNKDKELVVLLEEDIENKNSNKFYSSQEDIDKDMIRISSGENLCSSDNNSNMKVIVRDCPRIRCEDCPFHHKNTVKFRSFVKDFDQSRDYPTLEELKNQGFNIPMV